MIQYKKLRRTKHASLAPKPNDYPTPRAITNFNPTRQLNTITTWTRYHQPSTNTTPTQPTALSFIRVEACAVLNRIGCMHVVPRLVVAKRNGRNGVSVGFCWLPSVMLLFPRILFTICRFTRVTWEDRNIHHSACASHTVAKLVPCLAASDSEALFCCVRALINQCV